VGKQRERNRVKSRVDELPDDIRKNLDEMLADVNYTYQEIADKITEAGYEISKSSIGRYALRQNAVIKRLKEAAEQTRVIVETMKENQNLDAAEAANAILIDALTKKFATAQEEFENMPIDKAARVAVALERTAIFNKKFKLEYDRGFSDALSALKKALSDELQKDPELLAKMLSLAEKVAKDKENKSE